MKRFVINGVKIILSTGSEIDLSDPNLPIINSAIESSIKNGLTNIVPAFIHSVIKPDTVYGTVAQQCRMQFTGINQTAIIIHDRKDTIAKALYVNHKLGCIIKPTKEYGYWSVTTKPMRRDEKNYE